MVDDVNLKNGVGPIERLIGIFALLSLLAINIWYTSTAIERSERETRVVNEESQRRQCETLKLFIARFTVYPPENAGQEKTKRDHEELFRKNCS